MGAPHRLKYFRQICAKLRSYDDVAFWTGEQIADWYIQNGSKPPQEAARS